MDLGWLHVTCLAPALLASSHCELVDSGLACCRLKLDYLRTIWLFIRCQLYFRVSLLLQQFSVLCHCRPRTGSALTPYESQPVAAMFETAVLRRYDSNLHEEEWPQLELKDAIVTHHNRRDQAGKLVDLLEVDLHGPFRVRGKLGKLDKDQESIGWFTSLSHSSYRPGGSYSELAIPALTKLYSEHITLSKVYTYSLELKEDGGIVIWVLGTAGWYALSPAKEYKAIFEQMVEKAKIYHFMKDIYSHIIFRKKGKKLKRTVNDLYTEVCASGLEFSLQCPDSNACFSFQRNTPNGQLQRMLRPYSTSIISG